MTKWGKFLLALLVAVPGILLFAGPAQAAWVPGNGGIYDIKEFAGNNKCLDVVAFGTGNGTRLQRWDCGYGTNQAFQYWNAGIYNGRQTWQIRPRHVNGMCLDARGRVDGTTPLQIWQCNGGVQQRWVVESDAGTSYYFELKPAYNLTMCLDIASTQNGFPANLTRCDGTFGQVWSWI